MPLYEFYCPQCKTKFEELCAASRETLSCPECAAESKRVLSIFRARGGGAGGGAPSGGCSGCSGKNCGSC